MSNSKKPQKRPAPKKAAPRKRAVPRKKAAPRKPKKKAAPKSRRKPAAKKPGTALIPMPAPEQKSESGEDKEWQGARRGRKPKLDLTDETLDTIYKLGGLKCTNEEAAAFLSVALSTFKKFLNDNPDAKSAFADGKLSGNVSLRRNQMVLSKKNAAMAIWLGKQNLGQRERTEHELTGKGGGPIETKDVSARDVLASRIAGVAARMRKGGDPQGADGRAG